MSNITIGINVLKQAEAFGGKTVCMIGKCKTNYKALIMPNNNYYSDAPRIFSKRPNKNINQKPSLPQSAVFKNDFMASVSFI